MTLSQRRRKIDFKKKECENTSLGDTLELHIFSPMLYTLVLSDGLINIIHNEMAAGWSSD